MSDCSIRSLVCPNSDRRIGIREMPGKPVRIFRCSSRSSPASSVDSPSRSRSFVVYLQLGVEQQLHRLARDRSRPLLAGGDRRQKLQALAAVRNPRYEGLADLAFASDGLGVGPASKRICALVAAQWRREEAA